MSFKDLKDFGPKYKLNSVKDCINLLIHNVKDIFEPDKTDTGYNSLLNTHTDKTKAFNPNFRVYKYNYDQRLCNTADAFLTADQKKLKRLLEYMNEGSINVKNKSMVDDYLRIYTEHMRKVIKQDYPHLSDNAIAYILDTCLNKLINNLNPDENGTYNVTEAAKTFADECIKMAQGS